MLRDQRRGRSCGCAAATDDLRETVRARYAAAALATTDPTVAAGCCGPDAAVITDEQAELFGASLYADSEQGELPDTALQASLGCGNPLAMVDLVPGDVGLGPRLRRRDRRAALGPPRRAGRDRVRAGYDR